MKHIPGSHGGGTGGIIGWGAPEKTICIAYV